MERKAQTLPVRLQTGSWTQGPNKESKDLTPKVPAVTEIPGKEKEKKQTQNQRRTRAVPMLKLLRGRTPRQKRAETESWLQRAGGQRAPARASLRRPPGVTRLATYRYNRFSGPCHPSALVLTHLCGRVPWGSVTSWTSSLPLRVPRQMAECTPPGSILRCDVCRYRHIHRWPNFKLRPTNLKRASQSSL